jgi:hypothetical protein
LTLSEALGANSTRTTLTFGLETRRSS